MRGRKATGPQCGRPGSRKVARAVRGLSRVQMGTAVVAAAIIALAGYAQHRFAAATVLPEPMDEEVTPATPIPDPDLPPASLFGVQSDIQPETSLEVQHREIALMRDAGARWVRIVLNWYEAEPRKGHYNESYLRGMDALVRRIQEADMQVMLLVLATPPWANPAGWEHPPLRMRDLGEFVKYAVERFGHRVKHWEIWNEPDWHVFWRPAPDVDRFVEMLREAYTLGKAADPNAVFISGGLAGNNVDFLRRMYARGAGRYFDALGVHPYVFQRSPDVVHPDIRHSFHGLAELRKVMLSWGEGAKPIWITEMSWPTHRRAPGAVGDWAEGVSLQAQAAYLSRAYEKIGREYPFVQVAMWYNLRDQGSDPTRLEHNYGLVRHDFRPKPAYLAYAATARAAHPR